MKKNDRMNLAGGGKVDRLLRVNELIKRELAGEMERLNMPEANMLLSIVEVNASVDLRNATIYVSIFGGTPAGRRKAMEELEGRRIQLQSRLAKRLAFKHTPVLNFKLDSRLEKGDRVLAILSESENGEN